jgi:cytochrome P450
MGLHRRKDLVGPDAERFVPERWENWTPKRWEFLPFNHGARICLGRVFGAQQVEYVLARICQEYEELTLGEPGLEQQIKIELNTKMAHPVLIHFKGRKPQITENS